MDDWQILLGRLIALACFGAGLWYLARGLARLVLPVREMKWVPVNGRITLSGVEPIDHGDSTSYVPELQYQYHYQGIDYINERVAPLEVLLNSRWSAESLARKYPRGREVAVYVNPRNPGQSVLEPGRQVFAATGYALLGVVLCTLPILYVISR